MKAIRDGLVLARKAGFGGGTVGEIERYAWTQEMVKTLMRKFGFTQRLVNDLDSGITVDHWSFSWWLEQGNGKQLDDLWTCPHCGHTAISRVFVPVRKEQKR
jgi:hypothetical protein